MASSLNWDDLSDTPPALPPAPSDSADPDADAIIAKMNAAVAAGKPEDQILSDEVADFGRKGRAATAQTETKPSKSKEMSWDDLSFVQPHPMDSDITAQKVGYPQFENYAGDVYNSPNAALAAPDTMRAPTLAEQFKAHPLDTTGDYLANLGKSAVGGLRESAAGIERMAGEAPTTIGNAVNALGVDLEKTYGFGDDAAPEPATPPANDLTRIGTEQYEKGEAEQEQASGHLIKPPQADDSFVSKVPFYLQSTAESAPQLVAGPVTFAGLAAGKTYGEQRARGVAPGQAIEDAGIDAVANYATTKLMLNAAAGKEAVTGVAGMAKATGAGATSNLALEAAKIWREKYVDGQEISAEDVKQRLLDATQSGTVMGAAVHTVTAPFRSADPAAEARRLADQTAINEGADIAQKAGDATGMSDAIESAKAAADAAPTDDADAQPFPAVQSVENPTTAGRQDAWRARADALQDGQKITDPASDTTFTVKVVQPGVRRGKAHGKSVMLFDSDGQMAYSLVSNDAAGADLNSFGASSDHDAQAPMQIHPPGEGETNATETGQESENDRQKHPGDAQGGVSAEARGGGSDAAGREAAPEVDEEAAHAHAAARAEALSNVGKRELTDAEREEWQFLESRPDASQIAQAYGLKPKEASNVDTNTVGSSSEAAGREEAQAAPESLHPDERNVQKAHALAESIEGLSDEQKAAIVAGYPKPAKDPLTGYDTRPELVPTIAAAASHAAAGTPAFYAEVDFRGLHPLNEHMGGQAGADVHMKQVVDAFARAELEAAGAEVAPNKKGGDEFGFTGTGIDAATAHDALMRAQQKAVEYLQAQGVGRVFNNRTGEHVETGIHFAATDIRPSDTAESVLGATDAALARRKRGAPYERPGTDQTAGTGRGAGGRLAGSPEATGVEDSGGTGSARDTAPAETSRAEVTKGVTEPEARATLEQAFGKAATRKLEAAGLKLTSGEALGNLAPELSPNQRAGVKGLTTGKGAPHVIHDQTPAADLPGVAVHEVWHANADRVLSPGQQAGIARRVEKLAERSPAVRDALDKIPDGERTDGEKVAYALQHLQNQSLGRRVMDSIKLGLNRLGVPLDWLNAHEAAVREIGQQNLRHFAEGEQTYQTAENGREKATQFSREEPKEPGNQYSAVVGPQFNPAAARAALARGSTGNIPPAGRTPAAAAPNAPQAPRTPAQAASMVHMGDESAVREAGRGAVREALARRDLATAQADAGLDYFRRQYDSRPRDVITDPRRALQPIIDYQQGGLTAITDPLTQNFMREAQRAIDQRTTKIQAIGQREGKPLLQTLRENYFPQLWEQNQKSLGWAQDYYRKSPMQGDRSFLKQRVFDDIEQGLNAGYKPVSTNPVDLVMAKLWQMDKFIATHDMMHEMDTMGLLRDHPMDKAPPVGWGRVNDYTFTGKIVPESVAKSLNNILDPGLNKYGWWRSARYAENAILSARMGLSAFHAGFTTFDTLVAHVADGLDRIARGDVTGAIKSIAKSAISPLASPLEGRKLLAQVLGKLPADPQTRAVLDTLVSGGMRTRMDPTDYNNAYARFGRAMRQRDFGGMAKTAVPAVLEASTRYIMNSLVPYQKMSARVLMMKNELERAAGLMGTNPKDYAGTAQAMNPVALRDMAGRVNQLVDDRLGQVSYDNRFWNSTAKHIAQALVQAPGWNIGTLNVVGGPIKDVLRTVKPEGYAGPLNRAGTLTATRQRLTPRVTYLASVIGVTALYGAMRQYLTTGQSPESFQDLMMPRTGGDNPDGSPIREALPSYVKDMMELSRHPITTAEHKLNPVVSMGAELLHNKDYFGNEIRNPHDSALRQAGQLMTYLATQNMPYSVQNTLKARDSGKPLSDQLLPLVGVTQAPASATRSKFQEVVVEGLGGSKFSRTPEQAEQANKIYNAENRLRMGQNPDLSEFDDKTRRKIEHAVQEPMMGQRLKRLVGENKQAALDAWEAATPLEREKFKLRSAMFPKSGGFGKGWHTYLDSLDEDEKESARDRLTKAYEWSATQP